MVLLDHQAVSIAGTQTFESANTHLAGRSFLVRLARCTASTPTLWPASSTRLRAAFWLSADGGATWSDAGGIEAAGGVHVTRGGTELAETTYLCPIPANTNRVRATISVNATLSSRLTLEIL
jgi:hypothetical protein